MTLSGYNLLESRITKKLFIISLCVENYTKFLLFLLLLSLVAQTAENMHIVFTSALTISTSTALVKKNNLGTLIQSDVLKKQFSLSNS